MPETSAAPIEAANVAEAQNAATPAENNPEPAQEATEGAGSDADPAEQEGKEKAVISPEEKERERKARKAERATRKLYEENAVLRSQLAQRNASPQGEQQSPNTHQQSQDPVDVARQIIDIERFNARCNTIAEQGAKAYSKEFMPAWEAISGEIAMIDAKTGKPTPFFESITDLDNPADVIHHIGTNPDLLDELQDLTGRKLDRKLALIEAELKAKPRISNAPTPITPLKPRGTAGEPDPRNTKAWNDWYDKQRATARG